MATVMERLGVLVCDVFENDGLVISEGMSAVDVEGWDSMGNVRLFLAVEQEFGLRFGAGEIGAIKNVGELIQAIQRKLN